MKKRFLLFFTGVGVVSTLFLTASYPGSWFFCIAFFILGRIGFSFSSIFYDSFLTDVTTKKRFDWISANGYGFGYIGSVIPFLAVLGLILYGMDKLNSGAMPPFYVKIGFVIVAIWWSLLSIPIAKMLSRFIL